MYVFAASHTHFDFTVVDCNFTNNFADLFGGAIAVLARAWTASAMYVRHCDFEGNDAFNSTLSSGISSIMGAGMCCALTVQGC